MSRKNPIHLAQWPVVVVAMVAVLLSRVVTCMGAPALTCALISDPTLAKSAMGDLLQERLQAKFNAEGVQWVDRQSLAKTMAEQQLATAFGPDEVGRRLELGALLHADVLILLRSRKNEATTVEVVVCETSRGLRLAVMSISGKTGAALDPGTTAEALEPVVSAAILKARTPVKEIAAVPPFISNDLSYRYEPQKSAYATLVKQILLEQPGLVVVELEEARAIAQEVAVRGGGKIDRPLPLYVVGEFRHDPPAQPADFPRVGFKLAIKRGEKLLEDRALPPVAEPEVAGALRDVTGEVISKYLTTSAPPADPAMEATLLSRQAKLFMGLEDWQAALALDEASLLLRDDMDTRHDAVVACGAIHRQLRNLGSDTITPEQVNYALSYYLRGLEHLEQMLRTLPNFEPYRRPGQSTFLQEFISFDWGIAGHPKKESLAALEACREQAQEIFLRIARMRMNDRRGDAADYVNMAAYGLPENNAYALRLQMTLEWKDQPDNGARVYRLATHGYTVGILARPEGQNFLHQLDAIDNAEIRSTVASLRKSLDDGKTRASQEKAAWENELAEKNATEAARLAAGPPEVTFTKIELRHADPSSGKMTASTFARCIPAGTGTDAMWQGSGVYLMKQKDVMKLLWRAPGMNSYIDKVVYDGKYLWIPVARHGEAPMLMVADPESEKVWEISAADGLPLDQAPGGALGPTPFLRVAPVGVGRAIVAGTFGRAWLAKVEFDPTRGLAHSKKVNVFLEARDRPDEENKTQWKSKTVAFEPGYMFTLTEPNVPAGKSPEQKVVIARVASINVRSQPLLVDPETLEVTVAEDECCWADASPMPGLYDSVIEHDGAMWWAWPTRRTSNDPEAPNVFRFGWPDFRTKIVGKKVHLGEEATYRDRLVFRNGSIILAARQWWIADAPDKPFRALRGDIPDRMRTERLFRGGEDVRKWPDNETESVVALCKSNHYGLVCVVRDNHHESVPYQVEFPLPKP